MQQTIKKLYNALEDAFKIGTLGTGTYAYIKELLDELSEKVSPFEARVMQKIADTEQLLDQKVNYYEDLSYNHPDITIQQASVTFLKDLEDIMSSLLDKKLDRG